MPPHQRVLVAALLVFIGVTGTFALADGVTLGPDSAPVTLTPDELAARTAAVKSSERSIRTAITTPVPPLPTAPAYAPLGEPRLGPLVVFRVVPPRPTPPVRRTRPARRTGTPPTTTRTTPTPTATPTTPVAPPAQPTPKCEVHDDGLVECHAPEPKQRGD